MKHLTLGQTIIIVSTAIVDLKQCCFKALALCASYIDIIKYIKIRPFNANRKHPNYSCCLHMVERLAPRMLCRFLLTHFGPISQF